MNRRRKGFTLAETLISVTVLAVIAGLCLPILHNVRPDEDALLYKKGVYAIQRGIQKFMESPQYEELRQEKINAGQTFEENDLLSNFTREEVCNALINELNTKGRTNCSELGSKGNPNFVTTDGIAYYYFGGSGQFSPRNEEGVSLFQIFYMDSVKGPSAATTRRRLANNGDDFGLRLWINFRGTFRTFTDTYEETLIKDVTRL